MTDSTCKYCIRCGGIFFPRPRQGLERWNKRRFCSQACANRTSHDNKRQPLNERIKSFCYQTIETGCWIWMGNVDGGGYGTIRINRKMEKAHRASWTAFNGPIPSNMRVLHKCDVRACVNPDHLFLGTQLDNMADMRAKGRGPNMSGSRNANARLTEDQVRAIRSSNDSDVTLAERFEISRNMISNIRTGKNWKHL